MQFTRSNKWHLLINNYLLIEYNMIQSHLSSWCTFYCLTDEILANQQHGIQFIELSWWDIGQSTAGLLTKNKYHVYHSITRVMSHRIHGLVNSHIGRTGILSCNRSWRTARNIYGLSRDMRIRSFPGHRIATHIVYNLFLQFQCNLKKYVR